MENESRISRLFSRIGEGLNEQVWFRQLKSKWDELDAQSRTYLKLALAAATTLGLLAGILSAIWSVHDLRKQLAEKNELLNLVQSTNEEIRALQASTPGGGRPTGGADGDWTEYLQNTAGGAGIDTAAVTVSEEKAGAAGETAKESLFDVSLKDVNVRQLVNYAHSLEHGGRPVKLRNLSVDTKDDLSGYLNATLSVSAFTPRQEEE